MRHMLVTPALIGTGAIELIYSSRSCTAGVRCELRGSQSCETQHPHPSHLHIHHRVREVNKYCSRKARERKEDKKRDEEVGGGGKEAGDRRGEEEKKGRNWERRKKKERGTKALSQFLGIKGKGGTGQGQKREEAERKGENPRGYKCVFGETAQAFSVSQRQQ